MADLNPLLQLRDIHLPAPASNWPPAPGWIGLLVLMVLIFISIGIFLRKSYPTWQTKKQALQILKNYQRQYLEDHNSQKICASINELLKKTAFFYYPRDTVASLKGQAWLDFLNSTMQLSNHKSYNFFDVSNELLEQPYKNSQDLNLDNLFLLTKIWIKRQSNKKLREKLCLK